MVRKKLKWRAVNAQYYITYTSCNDITSVFVMKSVERHTARPVAYTQEAVSRNT